MNTCQHNVLPVAKCNSFMRLLFVGTEVSVAIVLFLTSEPFPLPSVLYTVALSHSALLKKSKPSAYSSVCDIILCHRDLFICI